MTHVEENLEPDRRRLEAWRVLGPKLHQMVKICQREGCGMPHHILTPLPNAVYCGDGYCSVLLACGMGECALEAGSQCPCCETRLCEKHRGKTEIATCCPDRAVCKWCITECALCGRGLCREHRIKEFDETIYCRTCADEPRPAKRMKEESE